MGHPTPDDPLGSALTSLFAAVDPVPERARAAASAAFGWRDLDAELATLTEDSLTGSGAASVRGSAPRLLSFATPDIAIDLEITEDGGTIRVLGQLSPARATNLAIEYAGGRREVRTDEIGRFHVEGLPAGWLRVVVDSGPDGRSHTEWVRT